VRVAYVGPLPPLRSGVADCTARLLPYLQSHFVSTRVIIPNYDPQIPSDVVDEIWRLDLRDRHWWEGGRYFPLYQMGNHSAFHDYVYDLLLQYPGITVLHDGSLLPFVHARTVEAGNPGAYVREAAFEEGKVGARKALDALHRGTALDPDAFLMLRRVVKSSLGVIVHSQHLRHRVLEVVPEAEIAVVSLPYTRTCPGISTEEAKRRLGYSAETLLIGAFGYIAPQKRVDVALRAFARLCRDWPNARFVGVGQAVPGYDLRTLVAELGIADVVDMPGYVFREAFELYLMAVDAAVNLRYPWSGENSDTLLHLLGAGVPTLVSDVGAFQELPDEAVFKIPIDEQELGCVEQALREILQRRESVRHLSEVAQRFVRETADPVMVARQYAAFMQRVI
jgi:glycosyltransferase involved in cell wall biosynthesis